MMVEVLVNRVGPALKTKPIEAGKAVLDFLGNHKTKHGKLMEKRCR
jgi:hypothetical protein